MCTDAQYVHIYWGPWDSHIIPWAAHGTCTGLCSFSEVPQGCKFEAPATEVREWLAVEAADRASRVFAAMEVECCPPHKIKYLPMKSVSMDSKITTPNLNYDEHPTGCSLP